MLAAGAHSEVQRRLTGFGVQRALGFGPGRIAAQQAVEAARRRGARGGARHRARRAGRRPARRRPARRAQRARPGPRARSARCSLALARGRRASSSPPPPGRPGAPPAARRSRSCAAATSRRRAPRASRRRLAGGLLALGVRFSAAAARGRWLAAVADDRGVRRRGDADARARVAARAAARGPGDVGKRYQLAVSLDAADRGRARRIPGVDAVGQRYSIDAADSFRLGEPVRLVAYPGDHTDFEDPPLAEGRRIRGPNEVEVGVGHGGRARAAARARCSRRRSRTAARSRFRVSGIVRALENDGRIAWVEPDRLLALRPDLSPQVVVRAERRRRPRGGHARARRPRRRRCGRSAPRRPTTPRSSPCSPRCCAASALAVGLVCLYALDPGADRHRARAPRRGRAAARVSAPTAPSVGLRARGRGDRGGDPRGARGRIPRGGRLRPARRPPRGGLRRASARADARPDRPRRRRPARARGARDALVARRVLREPVVAGLREE